MKIVAFDTETHLIRPGLLMPKLVCVSLAWRMSDKAIDSSLLDYEQGILTIKDYLNDKKVKLIGANIAYDLGVLCAEDASLIALVFSAYESNNVCCVQVRQKLIDIATGELKFRQRGDKLVPSSVSLAALLSLHLDEHLQKEDTYRLKYAMLDGMPINNWPREARDYAVNDAIATLKVFEAQRNKALEIFSSSNIPNECEQQRAAWALHLMGAWGIRTDPVMVERFIEESQLAIAKMKKELEGSGIIRTNGTKDMTELKRRVKTALGRLNIQIPLTDKGAVKVDKETCERTDDPALLAYASSTRAIRDFNQWKDVLLAGIKVPSCARYNVLVGTGRTSCADPNFQNPPRDGLVRECVIPRPGFVFSFVDYDTAELRSLAQVCLDVFGKSAMADALWRQHRGEGPDLHIVTAAGLLDMSIEDAWNRYRNGEPKLLEYRQLSKSLNFGLPGGIGAPKFVQYAWKSYGAKFTIEQAQHAKQVWFETYPEMRDYFTWISNMVGRDGHGSIQQIRSERIRGDVDFCSAANGMFQGLTADGAKEALWRTARACYAEKESPLYGSRPVIFMHDEIIAEVPEDRAHEAVTEQVKIMKNAMQTWLPDVPIECAPSLARRWYKGAKSKYVNNKLVPVKPIKETTGKIVWVVD